jgi:hypothetical protein
MADLANLRAQIQVEDVRYKASVSEYTHQKIGGAINFINTYQYKHFEFGFLKAFAPSGTPTYNVALSLPFVISDLESFPSNCEIVGITLLHSTSGSSGTTELDIEWASINSGTFASIFSTTPKATSAAPSDAQFNTLGIGTTPTGCTVPVLSKTTFNAGDVLRCKAISLQSGNPNGFLMRIFYRPT